MINGKKTVPKILFSINDHESHSLKIYIIFIKKNFIAIYTSAKFGLIAHKNEFSAFSRIVMLPHSEVKVENQSERENEENYCRKNNLNQFCKKMEDYKLCFVRFIFIASSFLF